MSQKAYITPEVLKWARESAKMSRQEAARNITSPAKLERWESGADLPSMRQARLLAKKYRRPLAVFFLPEPPQDFQTLRDFRKKNLQKEYSTALTFIIRELQNKQQWMRDFLIEQGEAKLPFVGRFSNDASPEAIAADIKKELGIEENDKVKDVFNYWREKIEAKRIFVSLTNLIHQNLKIDPDEVKGFALSDEYAPFIFVNTADYKNPQLFTLIHEVAHLWINASGVSGLNNIEFRDNLNKHQYAPDEILCNEVTGNVLMPKERLMNAVNEMETIDAGNVKSLSRLFGVSPQSILVRMRNLNLISKQEYHPIANMLEQEFEEFQKKEAEKEKESRDLPLYYILRIRRNSKAFTHFVYDSYKSGEISGSEASQLLNIKVNKFEKLEAHLT